MSGLYPDRASKNHDSWNTEARAAGLPSKEALALAVVDHLRDRWLTSTLEGADGAARGIERLQAMARASTDAYHRMSGYRAITKLCAHLLTARPDLAPELRTTFGAWIDATETVFRQAQMEGDIFDDLDARVLAEVAVAAFAGMQEISELMSGGEDLDDRVTGFMGLMMGLLRTPSGSAKVRRGR